VVARLVRGEGELALRQPTRVDYLVAGLDFLQVRGRQLAYWWNELNPDGEHPTLTWPGQARVR